MMLDNESNSVAIDYTHTHTPLPHTPFYTHIDAHTHRAHVNFLPDTDGVILPRQVNSVVIPALDDT